ncbi:MAG: cell division FtsK/SpoIIIE, partial [Candidatus Magasanikbacteria bacterium GW2011_GWA2_46_17]
MGRKKLSKKEKRERQRERNAFKMQGARLPVKTPTLSPPVTQVIWGLCFLAIASLAMLSLLSEASPAGKIFGASLEFSFGWGRWLFPLLLGFAAGRLIVNAFAPKKRVKDLAGLVKSKHQVPPILRFFGWGLSYLFFLSILSLIAKTAPPAYSWGGGWFGWMLSQPTVGFFGAVGAFIFDIFIIFLGIVIAEQDNLFILWEKLFHKSTGSLLLDSKKEEIKFGETKPVPVVTFTTANVGGKKIKLDLKNRKPVVDDISSHPKIAPWKGQNLLPPLDLLSRETRDAESGDVQEQAEIIRKTLSQFGIAVEMGEVKIGPTVTQYSLKPAEGVKLSQITNLKNNLAMALAAHSLRIEAPIPGTSFVGIEVPNKIRAIVPLRLVLESEDYQARKQPQLMIALGQDVSGKPWVSDIAKMPHLLIAGATGTGKSVCINATLLSLLFGHTPEQLRLILIDPKRVEMTAYNSLPHLLLPVVTEVSKTVTALKWCLVEMDRRYKELQKYGRKNIDAWNEWAEAQKESEERPDKMPYIVIVIDELADLMSVAQAEVENAIVRLAQMARAVGIHLVLATQRPSVDVITGLIKANITTRIAFMVASAVDSRTILDEKGAEDLSGQGDMLYSAADVVKPRRLQG